MFGIKLALGVKSDQRPHFYSLPSNPLPQRMSARDTRTWVEPLPFSTDNYLTFWHGNQLPGSYMHVTPHAAWIAVSSQDDLQPQYRGGSFGQVMGQLETAQLVQSWRLMWQNLQGRY